MEITITPIPDINRSVESVRSMEEQAVIAARLAGYRSVRHFYACALQELIDKAYPSIRPTETPRPATRKAKQTA